MAWIGASFYFIALDNHLEPPKDPHQAERGVAGEAWEVHGGGFYRVEKFRIAPRRLPEPLHWFKWEAYTTWLSGFALFIVVYYSHATSFLIDTSVADLTAWEAIALSVGGIVLAWVVYDALCRAFERDEALLAVLVFAFICASAWASWNLFAPRAAYLQVGRDDRDDDGRQRLLRDHSRPLGAHPGEGGGARARPALEHARARHAPCTTTT